jgi:tRNA (guanosine-2'-O-)-methyltransferase
MIKFFCDALINGDQYNSRPARLTKHTMTPQRFKKLQTILRRRQLDLTVLMDNVHKPHNLSAIMRTCDAVGIHSIHAVSKERFVDTVKDITQGTGKWVNFQSHDTLSEAVELLKSNNMQVLAAHPSTTATDFREIDYTKPTAIILGTELHGVSEEGLALADQHIVIPMLGMIDSLNVSVAAALILFEAQQQRLQSGAYQQQQLAEHVFKQILFEWSHPKLASFYTAKGLPYPELDEEGQVLESERHTQARLGTQK